MRIVASLGIKLKSIYFEATHLIFKEKIAIWSNDLYFLAKQMLF